MSQSDRWPRLAGLLILGLHPVLAQDEQPPDVQPAMEEVRVIGSRLINSKLVSPSPVLVINGADLIDRGITTLGEFSRCLPQNSLVSSESSSVNSPL